MYVCSLTLWLTWWWMLLYRTLRKVTSTNMRKNMYLVTPRCAAAAAVVSAVVLRRPTKKEYTHPYSMMHRRLTTAGIEVAPHYHQLLVKYPRSWTVRSVCVKVWHTGKYDICSKNTGMLGDGGQNTFDTIYRSFDISYWYSIVYFIGCLSHGVGPTPIPNAMKM